LGGVRKAETADWAETHRAAGAGPARAPVGRRRGRRSRYAIPRARSTTSSGVSASRPAWLVDLAASSDGSFLRTRERRFSGYAAAAAPP